MQTPAPRKISLSYSHTAEMGCFHCSIQNQAGPSNNGRTTQAMCPKSSTVSTANTLSHNAGFALQKACFSTSLTILDNISAKTIIAVFPLSVSGGQIMRSIEMLSQSPSGTCSGNGNSDGMWFDALFLWQLSKVAKHSPTSLLIFGQRKCLLLTSIVLSLPRSPLCGGSWCNEIHHLRGSAALSWGTNIWCPV